ncbi:MAG: hypothetical protein KC492_22785, partial [Myxococcales bacterium]|nr:hypothetical protein [Myxococcales bacterium]
ALPSLLKASPVRPVEQVGSAGGLGAGQSVVDTLTRGREGFSPNLAALIQARRDAMFPLGARADNQGAK